MTTMKIISFCKQKHWTCELTVREIESLLLADEQQQLSKLKCQPVYSCIFMTGWWFNRSCYYVDSCLFLDMNKW